MKTIQTILAVTTCFVSPLVANPTWTWYKEQIKATSKASEKSSRQINSQTHNTVLTTLDGMTWTGEGNSKNDGFSAYTNNRFKKKDFDEAFKNGDSKKISNLLKLEAGKLANDFRKNNFVGVASLARLNDLESKLDNISKITGATGSSISAIRNASNTHKIIKSLASNTQDIQRVFSKMNNTSDGRIVLESMKILNTNATGLSTSQKNHLNKQKGRAIALILDSKFSQKTNVLKELKGQPHLILKNTEEISKVFNYAVLQEVKASDKKPNLTKKGGLEMFFQNLVLEKFQHRILDKGLKTNVTNGSLLELTIDVPKNGLFGKTTKTVKLVDAKSIDDISKTIHAPTWFNEDLLLNNKNEAVRPETISKTLQDKNTFNNSDSNTQTQKEENTRSDILTEQIKEEVPKAIIVDGETNIHKRIGEGWYSVPDDADRKPASTKAKDLYTERFSPNVRVQGKVSNSKQHLSWGRWAGSISERSGVTFDTKATKGYWIAGQLTPVGSIPRSGTASYEGSIHGTAFRSNQSFPLGGNFTMTMDFESSSLAGGFTDLTYNENGVAKSFNVSTGINSALLSNGEITGNKFFGNIGSNIGQFKGAFYGPEINQVGGVFYFNKNRYNMSASGIFIGDKVSQSEGNGPIKEDHIPTAPNPIR